MKCILFFYCFFISTHSYGQDNELQIFRISSSHTSFPDTARASGHLYNNILYDAAGHYMDSSVLIIVPKKLDTDKRVDLVFWFHGWQNNIDSAAAFFKLTNQFAASHLNAVLVLAETTKNAPDSYGGKLEYPDTFKELVKDILQELKNKKVVAKKSEAGNILLAGHSGAYRVMAYILQNGNMPVQEVILFDALYGETGKFMAWLQSDQTHRLIDIYTDGGGTDGKSKELLQQLDGLNTYAAGIEEKELTPKLLREKRIVFIHSLHQHNAVISNPDNFQLFLENTSILERLK